MRSDKKSARPNLPVDTRDSVPNYRKLGGSKVANRIGVMPATDLSIPSLKPRLLYVRLNLLIVWLQHSQCGFP